MCGRFFIIQHSHCMYSSLSGIFAHFVLGDSLILSFHVESGKLMQLENKAVFGICWPIVYNLLTVTKTA